MLQSEQPSKVRTRKADLENLAVSIHRPHPSRAAGDSIIIDGNCHVQEIVE
jgi:hypothetical protein